MKHLIYIFNQRALVNFNLQGLVTAIRSANFDTLCDQYGLSRALIQPALAHLELIAAPESDLPIFTLAYRPKSQPPIIVTHWDEKAKSFERLITALESDVTGDVYNQVKLSTNIYCIELTEPQIKDLGLLLAYETARFLAAEGNGVVLGFDKIWYRLNVNQAFIPFDNT